MTEPLTDAVADAMQRYWNNWCADTGSIPPEFTIRGPSTTRVYADFRDSGMVSAVAEVVDALRTRSAELERVVEAARDLLNVVLVDGGTNPDHVVPALRLADALATLSAPPKRGES